MTLNLDKFSSIEKHLDSENKMGNRIKLPYKTALEIFVSCMQSNQNLAFAFNNFKIYKNILYDYKFTEDI